jgi:hypothetical protein
LCDCFDAACSNAACSDVDRRSTIHHALICHPIAYQLQLPANYIAHYNCTLQLPVTTEFITAVFVTIEGSQLDLDLGVSPFTWEI